MFLFKVCVGLVVGVAMLINAAPLIEDGIEWEPLNTTSSDINSRAIGHRDSDPAWQGHLGKAAVEIWMGKDSANVGNMIGSDLYDTIWKRLDAICPSSTENNQCHSRIHRFTSTCMAGKPGKVEECTIEINSLFINWDTEQIRKLLIGAAAGALEASTLDPKKNDNCYDIPGHGRGCNVANGINIYMPNSGTMGEAGPKRNEVMFKLSTKQGLTYGKYNCCLNLKNFDKKIDPLGGEVKQAFPQWTKEFSRDTRCNINGWELCPGV